MNHAIGSKQLVITDRNRIAATAATTLATSPRAPFNTLLVTGGGGTGKTHLLRSVEAMHRALHPDGNRIFINAGELVRWPDVMDDAAFAGADLVLVDDIDLLAAQQAAQEALLAVIDTVERLALGRVAMTSSVPAHELAAGRNMMPRLLSRLYAAAGADLQQPDFDMRVAIIRAELGQWRDIEIGDVLVDYMARNLPADGHIIAGATKRVALQAQIAGTEPSVAETYEILRESFNARKRIPVAAIQARTSAHFHIPLGEMTSQRRAREVARPRQVSMFLSKLLTPKSLPDIGRLHGGRDHTTVIHAIRQIEKLRIDDAELDTSIRLLERELTH